jgi:hypothetical protein
MCLEPSAQCQEAYGNPVAIFPESTEITTLRKRRTVFVADLSL